MFLAANSTISAGTENIIISRRNGQKFDSKSENSRPRRICSVEVSWMTPKPHMSWLTQNSFAFVLRIRHSIPSVIRPHVRGSERQRERERARHQRSDNDSPPTKLINVWFRAKSIFLFSSAHSHSPALISPHSDIYVLFIVIVVENRFAAPSSQNKIIIYKWNYIVARYSVRSHHTRSHSNYETSLLLALEDFSFILHSVIFMQSY